MNRSSWAWLGICLTALACGESERHPSPTGGAAGTDPSGGLGGGSSTDGGSQVGGSGAGGSGSAIDAYTAQYAVALCSILDRCWASFTAELDETCESYFERELREGPFANVAAAVADGRVQYHGDRAESCLDTLANADCGEGLAIAPDDCAEVFVGSLQTGDPCTLDAECAGGAQCLVGQSCPGECGPRGQEGQACTSDNRCQSELICLVSATSGGVCATQVSQQGGVCSQTMPCTSFFYCAGLDRSDPESTGTCEPRDALYRGALNDACGIGAASELCEVGLVCVFQEGTTGTCQEGVTSGSPCQYALPDACPRDEYCRIADTEVMPLAGTCSKRPALDEECAYSEILLAPCATDQYCSTATGACEPGKHVGEPCLAHEDCFSETCEGAICVVPLECTAD